MLFACEKCNVVDDSDITSQPTPGRWFCACCCKPNGYWHNQFPRRIWNPALDVVCNKPSGLGLEVVK